MPLQADTAAFDVRREGGELILPGGTRVGNRHLQRCVDEVIRGVGGVVRDTLIGVERCRDAGRAGGGHE